MGQVINETLTCNNCSKPFNEGNGISGYDEENYLKSYDWECAIALKIEVDSDGCLRASQ